MNKYRERQTIENVAWIIYEHYGVAKYSGTPDNEIRANIQRVNDVHGFTFDVRWVDGEYISENDWTRVEGMQLTPSQLDAAWDLAMEWVRVTATGSGRDADHQ